MWSFAARACSKPPGSDPPPPSPVGQCQGQAGFQPARQQRRVKLGERQASAEVQLTMLGASVWFDVRVSAKDSVRLTRKGSSSQDKPLPIGLARIRRKPVARRVVSRRLGVWASARERFADASPMGQCQGQAGSQPARPEWRATLGQRQVSAEVQLPMLRAFVWLGAHVSATDSA